MSEKKELLSLGKDELAEELKGLGQPAFRAKQLFVWLHKGKLPAEMMNLPLPLRETLAEQYICNPVEIIEEKVSKIDGTRKFLYQLPDHHLIEGVLMKYHYGYTLCLSTQVGCKMGCLFCASTLNGCIRNLTAGEMLGQILAANRRLQMDEPESSVGNLVLMGSGEPFDNYENVLKFLRLLKEPDGLCIGMRSISLSTCGLVPEMKRFSKEGLPVTLSLSLHAPNDAIRKTIMPVAKRYSMEEVLSACRYYVAETGRRVIFEYALIHGVNASPEHARELASKIRNLQCHVNLIPLNSVPERGLRGVSEKEVHIFMAELQKANISVTRRREMGDDIEGACGQLRRHYLNLAES
ncbi:MAG: 23S rRNA (adenine(2503)-C(2))-methyltransferase RlmN [Clostridia bacterium]|nr:23S rRNA (adenine(2503)-C(2))-methyltransferase RlmN [Clostridia bacterium]